VGLHQSQRHVHRQRLRRQTGQAALRITSRFLAAPAANIRNVARSIPSQME
jgi:hypothetical protein